jgi:hypothetical protein
VDDNQTAVSLIFDTLRPRASRGHVNSDVNAVAQIRDGSTPTCRHALPRTLSRE